MAHITGLAGVLIWTGNFAPMRDFYIDVLGLAPRHVKPDFVNFEWAGTRLSVAQHSEVVGESRDPLRVMVNFVVENIQATHALLAEKGVTFLRNPEQEPWGGWVATFSDPDGNTLQLLQLPAASNPSTR